MEGNETATDVEARAPAETPEPQGEVRSEEIGEGVGVPETPSAWGEEVVAELAKPLDPNRVRVRQGKYEYLAGHDVKRRASQIFGFGNWGHNVVSLEEIGAVEVANDSGRTGWHIGYRCIVRVWVATSRYEQFETEGIGYGDGVEYTPAARIRACELAMKEAETDALKRAFVDLGDQFGLILYAKGDEKARIERDRNAETAVAVRVQETPRGARNWADWVQRFASLIGGTTTADLEEAKEWLREAVALTYGVESNADLTSGERREAFVWANATLLELEETEGGLEFSTGRRATISTAFAKFWKGIAPEGPPWRLGPDEPDRPTYEEWLSASASEPLASKKAPPTEEPPPETPAAVKPS